ncbi:GNAT family N-acetyltransferase [Algoriphagus namhaensis]|uniref:GNAT family N-acetyltransferase n=1 Tax=Algoriphagus namhaensis TaxID=915353 RepID=A0ABV8AUG8_9BACT
MITPHPDLKLQPITEKDHKKLFDLMKKIYTPAYSHFWIDQGEWYLELCYNIDNLKKELARERSHYFFIQWSNKTIGILKYDFPFSPREIEIPNAMKLHRLYLHPSTHGKGIAPKIMTYLEEIAKSNGLDTIWLEAMARQEQAKCFYKKMGYKLIHSYKLDFERFNPGFEQIQILQKKLN